MTSHELARQLLELEDMQVSFVIAKNKADLLSNFIVVNLNDPYNLDKKEKAILLNGTLN